MDKYLFFLSPKEIFGVILKIKMNDKNFKKVIILITRKLQEKIEKKLENSFSVILNKNDKKYSYKELKKKIQNVDILVPCVSDTVDASIIKSGNKELALELEKKGYKKIN